MTTYLNTFTGSTIAPSNATLSTVTYVAGTSSISLVWNLNGYDTTTASGNFAADYVFLNGSLVTSPILYLPPANQVSPGTEITLVNLGTNSIQINANGQVGQTPIVTINSSNSVKVVVRDNASAAGQWAIVTTSAAGGLASITGLAGRGIAVRATGSGNVFDTVFTNTAIGGGAQTIYPALASQVLTFSSAAQVTLATATSATDPTVPQIGTYYILKNISTGRLEVTAQVLDGVTNGTTYVAPGAFGIFAFLGNGAWVSMIGSVSQGTSINSSSGIAYNATIVDCQAGSGASGSTYTLQNQDFGTVIDFQNVQVNQTVILPQRVALYVVHNAATATARNITFRGAGSIAGNTVTITGTQYSVLATDGIGNVYPGVSSLPGGQFVNANPGTAALPGMFFDNDESTGFYSGNVDGVLSTAVAGSQAETLFGNASSLTHQLGTTARPVNSTIIGNQNVTGTFGALGGIDGGVI